MYVFRPQHAPGCGAGHHLVNRSTYNAGKIQRRPKDRPRCRLPLQARRKLQLRDEPGNAGAEAAAATTRMPETFSAKHEHPSHAWPSDEKRNAVRDRLRSRLVQRRTNELVVALLSRHGDGWTFHVLPGGFHAVEAMKRICEGFGLRPDLERQVLKAVSERARTWTNGASEALSQHTDTESGTFLLGGSDEEDAQSSRASFVGRLGAAWPAQQAQEPRLMDLESSDTSYPHSDVLSPARSLATSPTYSQLSSELTPCLCSSDGTEEDENDDAESLGWTLEEPPPPGALEQEEAACSWDGSRAALYTWRAPWRTRVLSTLGLDRWWSMPPIGALSTPELVGLTEIEQTMLEEAGITEGVEEESAEDMALSSKLVAAVLNAERQATSSSEASDDGSLCSKSEPSEAQKLPSPMRLPQGRQQSLRPREVKFAESSKICFFDAWPDRCLPSDGYHRCLETKVFDGPSGHKAKRDAEEDSDDADSSASEEEEWEDRCDDIAELMSRERHMLMWSDSW